MVKEPLHSLTMAKKRDLDLPGEGGCTVKKVACVSEWENLCLHRIKPKRSSYIGLWPGSFTNCHVCCPLCSDRCCRVKIAVKVVMCEAQSHVLG